MRALLAGSSLSFGLLALLACGRSDLGGDFGVGGEGGAGSAGGGLVTSTGPGPGTGGGAGVCSNFVVDPGEECDDGNLSSFDSCVGCVKAYCGDGFAWPGFEQCDDGNFESNDSCTAYCELTYCGDGILWAGVEQCDDGNFVNNDDCADCTIAHCGDGILKAGVEECDDGNTSNVDACPSSCSHAFCGDGHTWQGVELCDDADNVSTNHCIDCVPAACGDGHVWAGVEECDDGNLTPGDGCSSSCTLGTCGDGFVDPGEACDLGLSNANRPAFLLMQGALSKAVEPVDRSVSAASFYAHFSNSSHTGYEAVQASRLFLYRDLTTGVLSLFLHHGIDFNASGQMQPQAKASFDILGLPAAVIVAVADDSPNEFSKNALTSAKGNWTFQNNSDGGVLSGLPIPGAWSIDLVSTFSGAIATWAYVDGDDSLQGLALGQTVTLKAFDTPSPCRLDCSVPACGDGILDGGEICDDGNSVGGDGCSADCASLL